MLGVIYTLQPLVQFMIASVEHVLREHFDTSLDAKGVHIFDPFTGTEKVSMQGLPKVSESMLIAVTQ